jgi:hypothetical protein
MIVQMTCVCIQNVGLLHMWVGRNVLFDDVTSSEHDSDAE